MKVLGLELTWPLGEGWLALRMSLQKWARIPPMKQLLVINMLIWIRSSRVCFPKVDSLR